jgi:hypothetical protein
MNLAERVRVPPHVMARLVGEDCVMLNLESGTYFGLDPVGARMWDLLADGKSLGEACDALAGEFDASRSQIEADLAQLVTELAAHGLIERG